ncbi:Acetolactate synthase large subunit [Caballeronia sordidicola]|uniref:Acetolactate synthase large subunit n=1 Tax=Caballeronia sordidicola TaxID=196367 RepID=A0A242N9V6_CABSO|nr:Acetolactate synthase large subunit [Caballeronia sordidicola]
MRWQGQSAAIRGDWP